MKKTTKLFSSCECFVLSGFWSQHSPMSIAVSCDSGWNSPYLAPSQSSIYWLATTQPNWLHSNKSRFLSLTCLCCHNVNFYCNHLEKAVTMSKLWTKKMKKHEMFLSIKILQLNHFFFFFGFFVPIKLTHIVHNYLQPISLLHDFDVDFSFLIFTSYLFFFFFLIFIFFYGITTCPLIK